MAEVHVEGDDSERRKFSSPESAVEHINSRPHENYTVWTKPDDHNVIRNKVRSQVRIKYLGL